MSTSPPSKRERLKSSDIDDDSQSSLTPQRKHHKLLKDGSEVWSKEVEQIFVEGMFADASTVCQPAVLTCPSSQAFINIGSRLGRHILVDVVDGGINSW